jgi:hypothetical protein
MLLSGQYRKRLYEGVVSSLAAPFSVWFQQSPVVSCPCLLSAVCCLLSAACVGIGIDIG